MTRRNLLLQAWKTITTLLDIQSLWLLLGGGSAATVIAAFAQRMGAGLLVAFFGSVAGFAAGSLLARWAQSSWRRYHYKTHQPTTTHELVGGASLTYVIHHSGLSVRVRARVRIEEFGDDLDAHPEPFDMLLQTEPYGGAYQSIVMDDAVDMAKAILATVTELNGGRRDSYLTLHYPGLGDVGCVVNEHRDVLLNVCVTLYVTTPVRLEKTTEMFKVSVNEKTIRVWEKAEKKDSAPT
jgi:hypothetical protein